MKVKQKFVFIIFILFNICSHAEYKNDNYPQLNTLKKLTVGPDDQLDSAVDLNNKFLIFTKKANLISQLQVKDLETGEIKDLLPSDADSNQGKISPNGQLVFTYYKYNSFGNICWSKSSLNFDQLPLNEEDLQCVPYTDHKNKGERSQGFWYTQNEIIYLEKNGLKYHLVLYNTQSSSRREIITSQSPIVSAFGIFNGSLIVYSEVINKIPQIIILKLKSGEKNLIPSKLLPGISGLLNLSEDEKTLYFSHYMTDSNKDGIIDGHDNAVVWKIQIEALEDYFQISKRGDLKLEQLTPMDLNCSYPFVNQKNIFLTCAFQGSLDIYQLPEEGVIPKNWDDKILNESFMTSRTYPDRILILNAKKFRTSKDTEIHLLDQRLMNLHMMAEDYLAAQFYLSKIKNSQENTLNAALEILFQALELEKIQPKNTITLQFKESLEVLLKKLTAIKLQEPLKKLLHLNLQVMLGRRFDLKTIHSLINPNNSSLEYWLYYRMIQKLVPYTKENSPTWTTVYKRILNSTSLSLESQIYYAYETLDFIALQKIEDRKQMVSNIKAGLLQNKELQALFENELHILNLIGTSDAKSKLISLQNIDKLLNEFKTNYFLRKAMNVRCILNFLNHQEFKNLNIIAANWLRDTPKTSTEFSYARQVVIRSALEQAYGYWQKKSTRIAADYFFQSLSLTDDLESHSGYMNTMSQIDQKMNLLERMEYLENHGSIPDGAPWLKIFLLLDEKDPEQYAKNLDLALKDLSRLRSDLNDPLKYLLIGYIYLEKIQYSQKGVEIDVQLLKDAHQNLILASDLARENPRIRAAALTNLGLLHLWNQNYGQSIKFWELRKNLGFEGEDQNTDYKSFLWFYSQTLFLNNQNKAAVEVLQLIPPHQISPEVIERIAFYHSRAENWSTSLENYQKLEKIVGLDFETIPEPSRSKIRLNKAYVLFKMQKLSDSQKLFKKIAQQDLKKFPVNNRFRKMEFDPANLENIVQGFLSQMGTDKERIQALERRIQLLGEDLPNLIQSQIRLAELLYPTDFNASMELMQSALKNCRDFANENGSLGQTVFKTLVNYLVHGLLNPNRYSSFNSKNIKEQVQKTLASFQKQSDTANLIALKNQWHLQYLWNLYQEQVLKENRSHWKKSLLESSLTEKIRHEDPEGLKTLQIKLDLLAATIN